MTTSTITDFDLSIFDSIPSIPAAEQEKHEYEIVPAWTFIARCYSIIDMGTQEDNYKGEIKNNRKVSIKFELPTKKDSEGRVFTTYVDYNMFIWGKTNLTKFLQSWRGATYTQDELEDFHIFKEYLNKPCQITIEHKVSTNGNTYAKISSISPLMEGIECPARVNDIVWFSFASFRREAFESLNDKLKEIIAKSPEYKSLQF